MSVVKVYRDFYSWLVTALPMKDAIFLSNLMEKHLFFGNVKSTVGAQPTQEKAAEYFLDNVIGPSLNTNDDEPFNKLLLVMQDFSPQLEKIANKIMQSLDEGLPTG